MANPTKKTLSKNLTQMKFMRRVSQPLDKDEADSSGALIEKWIAPNVPEPTKKSGITRVSECGFMECEGLDVIGRFSFNKFNKEIEKLSHVEVTGTNNSEEDDGTIPAEEVARRYEEITSRKFLGKRKLADGREGSEKNVRHDLIEGVEIDKHGFMKPL